MKRYLLPFKRCKKAIGNQLPCNIQCETSAAEASNKETLTVTWNNNMKFKELKSLGKDKLKIT